MTVENNDASTPVLYVGVPVTYSGGHASAHAPVQSALPAVLSLSHTYSVLPFSSTRTLVVPTFSFLTAASATVAVACDDDPPVVVCEYDDPPVVVDSAGTVAAGVAVVPVVAVDFLLLLPHAASA